MCIDLLARVRHALNVHQFEQVPLWNASRSIQAQPLALAARYPDLLLLFRW